MGSLKERNLAVWKDVSFAELFDLRFFYEGFESLRILEYRKD